MQKKLYAPSSVVVSALVHPWINEGMEAGWISDSQIFPTWPPKDDLTRPRVGSCKAAQVNGGKCSSSLVLCAIVYSTSDCGNVYNRFQVFHS